MSKKDRDFAQEFDVIWRACKGIDETLSRIDARIPGVSRDSGLGAEWFWLKQRWTKYLRAPSAHQAELIQESMVRIEYLLGME